MFKRIKEFIYQVKLEKNWDERTGTAPIAFEITEEERIQLEKDRENQQTRR
jgi:hypothetical protein